MAQTQLCKLKPTDRTRFLKPYRPVNNWYTTLTLLTPFLRHDLKSTILKIIVRQITTYDISCSRTLQFASIFDIMINTR